MLITNHINKKYKLDPTRSQKYRINEDVAKSNKVLKSIESLEIDPLEIEKIKKVIGELKKYLVENNSIGYLGTFTKMLYNMSKLMYYRWNIPGYSGGVENGSYERARYGVYKSPFKISEHTLLADLISVYKKIKKNKDIITNLRDGYGNLVRLEDCKTIHNLEKYLDDLSRWRTFNNFIKGFPKAQKDLIWENGYFKKDVKVKDRYKLYKAVVGILKESREELFLKKVSNIKTLDEMIDRLVDMGKAGTPWEIDIYLNIIEKSKDVKIVYNEKNYLILRIDSAKEVMKYCGDTAWCILNDGGFKKYYLQGDFFAVLNFNKNSFDRLSKIGVTYRKGIIYHCLDKFDRPLNPKDIGLGDIKLIIGKDTPPIVNNPNDNQNPVKKGGILKIIKNWLDYHYGDMEL